MSSVDWLGECNPSWGYAPLFTLGDPKKTPNTGMLESNLLSLSYGKIVRRDIESSDGLVPASYETYQIVEPGDTVLRFTDLQNDQRSLRSGLVEERGIITSAYMSFTPDRRKLNPAFFAHMMRAVDLSKVFYRMGSGVRQSLNWGEFSLMRLPLPPLETQQRIADYLDRETAEIDAAVADLDRYVELLNRRRQQLTSEVVAGFTGPLRNLESLPYAPLGTLLSAPISDGPHSTPDFLQEGIPFLSVDGIQDGELVFEGCRFISPEDHEEFSLKTRPQKDDILMGKAASTGKIALVRDHKEFSIWSPLAVIRTTDKIDSEFLTYALKSNYSQMQIDHLCSFNTQKNIAMRDIPRIRVPFPSLSSQRKAVAYLNRETADVDSLLKQSRELRDLFLKRRSVLITDVVTGRKQV